MLLRDASVHYPHSLVSLAWRRTQINRQGEVAFTRLMAFAGRASGSTDLPAMTTVAGLIFSQNAHRSGPTDFPSLRRGATQSGCPLLAQNRRVAHHAAVETPQAPKYRASQQANAG